MIEWIGFHDDYRQHPDLIWAIEPDRIRLEVQMTHMARIVS